MKKEASPSKHHRRPWTLAIICIVFTLSCWTELLLKCNTKYTKTFSSIVIEQGTMSKEGHIHAMYALLLLDYIPSIVLLPE